MPQPALSDRRPSARRGSSSAPDPFNVHAEVNLDPNRSSTSTLTILKISDEPGSHRKSLQRKFSPAPPAADSPTRLSFAFSSFSDHTHPSSPTRVSPSSSPRLGPSSPRLSAHFPTRKPRLTPDQIVDLARQAANPTHTSNSHVFTPLPDDVYLPFLDRPAEVAALIAAPPDLKLFALLAQTFPLRDHEQQPQANSLPRDPTAWSYHHLIHHLTKVDRDLAPDFLWSIAARKCILSHSELIWERVKGALGIPPELDVDYDFLDDDQASPEPSEDGDLHGEKDDKWEDALLDSPVTMRLSTRLPASLADHDDHRLPIPRDFAYSESLPSDDPHIQISIEPLVASDATNSHPPLSLPTSSLGEGLGLGDIAEGAEEEDEDDAHDTKTKSKPAAATSDPFDSVLPSQIQGLRILTSSSSSSAISPLTATGTAITPFSVPHPSSSSAPPTAHSRTSSVSSLVGPFNRSESTGTLSSLWIASSQAGVFSSGSDAGDSHDGKEEGMGPMFPGNFARLGGGLRRLSSSSTKKAVKLPHARYIASGVIPPAMEGGGTANKEKSRAYSHTGGQRPFVQPAQRRRSWGAGAGVGMSPLSGV